MTIISKKKEIKNLKRILEKKLNQKRKQIKEENRKKDIGETKLYRIRKNKYEGIITNKNKVKVKQTQKYEIKINKNKRSLIQHLSSN